MSIVIDDKKITDINISNKNVQKIVDILTGKIIFEKTKPVSNEYFYIENTFDGDNTILLKTTIGGTNITGSHATQLQYSKDKETWTTITLSGTNTIPMNSGEKVYFRNDSGSFNWYNSKDRFYTQIKCSNNHKVGGNINSLLDYNNYNVATTPYCFYHLFYKNEYLTDASELIFSKTSLAPYCYQYMFYNCTSLTAAPALPATTLAEGCYQGMFNYCTSLNYIKCLALNDSSNNNDFRNNCEDWVNGVSDSGTFISSDYYSHGWYWGNDGVPKNWTTKTESGNPFEPSNNNGTQIYQSNGLTVYEMGSFEGGYEVQANGNVMEVHGFEGNDYCFAMMKISSDQGYGVIDTYITPHLGNSVTVYISDEVYDDNNCPFHYNYNDENNNVLYSLTSGDNGIQKPLHISDGNCIWVKFVKNKGNYESDYPSISMDF